MRKILYRYIDPITKRNYKTVVEDWDEKTHGEWPYDHPVTHIVEINLEEDTLYKELYK